jgi:hypothetical protein
MSKVKFMGKAFKILSIDGGGIKGLYSAKILQYLEEVSNHRVSDCFDMICGTSTGGLIALALSINKPASEIVEFYKKYGVKIFPHKNMISYFISFFTNQLFWGGKYSDKELRNSLIQLFGLSKIKDAHTFLCIPSYNLNLGRPRVFKKDHHNLILDNNFLMIDVGLATSAAPTYFPIADLDNQYFVDGGVWANNPSICGFIEAKKYFINENDNFDSIELLSISSLTINKSWERGIRKKRSILGWREKLFELPLNSQSYFADYFLGSISKLELNYKRIPSFENLSAFQEKQIKLDYASNAAIELIESLGKDVGTRYSKEKDILNFFKKREN